MKDYYSILGVTQNCSEDEIRKQYRKLAMQYHPDRNPDSPEAEEKFKEIAEAYGVLTDPEKRQQYDTYMHQGGPQHGSHTQGNFSYSQEEILRDLFNDPRFQQMFQGLFHEFQKSGLQGNSSFLRQSFFGGKKGAVFGGIFFFGSLAGPALMKKARKEIANRPSLLSNVGKAVGSLLGRGNSTQAAVTQQSVDTTYQTPLSEEELRDGKEIQMALDNGGNKETLKIKIPPGSRYGQKLRLKGKGQAISGSANRGDLYLKLCEKNR